MKRANIIFTAVLLAMVSTGCGMVIEEPASNVGNSIETHTETQDTAEAETTAVTEAATTAAETTVVTEAATTAAESETTEATEASTSAEKKEVFALNGPLAQYQSPDEFGNATFAASFEKDDIVKTDDGKISVNVMIYRYELFSADNIKALKKGDVIWCLGNEVLIDTIETNNSGAIIINGGIENGGRVLKTDDGTVYFESGMNDVKSYYEIGEKTFVLAEDFILTDSSDLDNPVTYTAEEFFTLEHGAAGFIKSNTLVKTTDNIITSIERRYIP